MGSITEFYCTLCSYLSSSMSLPPPLLYSVAPLLFFSHVTWILWPPFLHLHPAQQLRSSLPLTGLILVSWLSHTLIDKDWNEDSPMRENKPYCAFLSLDILLNITIVLPHLLWFHFSSWLAAIRSRQHQYVKALPSPFPPSPHPCSPCHCLSWCVRWCISCDFNLHYTMHNHTERVCVVNWSSMCLLVGCIFQIYCSL